MRNNKLKLLILFVFLGLELMAVQRHTGQLVVTLVDTDCRPITNATVTVNVAKNVLWGRGCDSEYNNVSTMTDSNGIAAVTFDFYNNHFMWFATAPSHYCCNSWHDEHFNSTVVNSDYLYCETNTVEGLARYNELKALEDAGDYISFTNLLAKFEPKSVTYTGTRVERSMCCHPKRNPQPMYYHDGRSGRRLPMKDYAVTTNGGATVKHYQNVDFDMKIGRFTPPWGGRDDFDPGEVSDFRIVRSECTTNGVVTRSGWIEFAPGCGAYKGSKANDGTSFPGYYAANTNAEFLSRIPFEAQQIEGKWRETVPLLSDNEYMVLRTRAVTNDVGDVTNYNYSVFVEKMNVPWSKFAFRRMYFNPRPNDINLEFDSQRNLSKLD